MKLLALLFFSLVEICVCIAKSGVNTRSLQSVCNNQTNIINFDADHTQIEIQNIQSDWNEQLRSCNISFKDVKENLEIRFNPNKNVKCDKEKITLYLMNQNNTEKEFDLCELIEKQSLLPVSKYTLIIQVEYKNLNAASLNSSYPFDQFESITINKYNQDSITTTINISSSTQSTTAIKTSKISTTLTTNFTKNDPSYKNNSSVNFFIGLLIILVILTGILTGIWLYGRRRRKWREILAHLENNTDWEYEQLEDGPSLSSTRATVSQRFNPNFTNQDNETNLSNSITKVGSNQLNERTRINY